MHLIIWIYRKAAEAAKGRREFSEILGQQNKSQPAPETIAYAFELLLRFLCDLCGFAVKIMHQPYSPA